MKNPVFTKALQDYMTDNHVSTSQLVAKLNNKWSYPVVRRWIRGAAGPSKEGIAYVSKVIGIDEQQVICGNITSAEFGLLSLDSINARYELLRARESKMLFEVINIASVFCFNLAIREGLAVEFKIDELGHGIIMPSGPVGAGLTIAVSGGDVCLMVAVRTLSNDVTSNVPLNTHNLQTALKQILT